MAKIVSKIILIVVFTALLLGLSACSKSYNVGDTGPAGGIIFYDKGQVTDGWRYLEAAPAGVEFKAKWGYYGTAVTGTNVEIGWGKKNTDIIANMGDTSSAAYMCRELDIKGYKDWFLPSKDELEQMYKILYKPGLGGFSSDMFWSSSVGKDESHDAWFLPLSGGYRYGNSNYNHSRQRLELSVRACRAF